MSYQPKLSVGTFFEEVDGTGVLHYYRVLAIVDPRRNDDLLRPLELVGDLATSEAITDQKKRITWDISGGYPHGWHTGHRINRVA